MSDLDLTAEYRRQAQQAAAEAQASAERAAASASASAEAAAAGVLARVSGAAASAESASATVAGLLSQAEAARDRTEAYEARARAAATAAETAMAETASDLKLVRGFTRDIKLPECGHKGILMSEDGVYVSWSDPPDIVLGDNVFGEWARTELWRLEIPDDVDTAYPEWPLGADGSELVAVSTPEGGRDAFMRSAFLDTGARADRRYGYRLVSYNSSGGATMRDEDRLPVSSTLSWSILGALSRSGALQRILPVGSSLEVRHPDFPNNTLLTVVGFDGVVPADSTIRHTTQLQFADCLYRQGYLEGMSFDFTELLYALTQDLLAVAGRAYYVNFWPLAEGTDWSEGDDISAKGWYELLEDGRYTPTSDTQTVGGKVYYQRKANAWRKLAEGTDWTAGMPVPADTWYEASPNTQGNYGNNDVVRSNLMRWLNSDQPANRWFTPATPFDQVRSSDSNINGFLYNFPEDLASQLVECVRTANVSTYNGGSGGVQVVYRAKVVLPTRYEAFGSADNTWGPDGLKQWEGLLTNESRIRLRNGSASNWWLASPYVGSGDGVWDVAVSGTAVSRGAHNAYGVAPALSI